MEFRSTHGSYMIQNGKDCIVFKNGKYKTENKKEIALLENFPDVTAVKVVAEKEKEVEKESKSEKK